MSMHVLPLFYSNMMCQNEFDMKCRVIDESDRSKVCTVEYGILSISKQHLKRKTVMRSLIQEFLGAHEIDQIL